MWLEGNCFPKIVERVLEIWSSAGFNTEQLVTKARQKQILKKLHYQYRLHCSKNKSKKSKTSSEQFKNVTQNLTKLFDIAECKCINNCQCLSLELKKFLNNQRNEKTMKIADINIKTIPEKSKIFLRFKVPIVMIRLIVIQILMNTFRAVRR